MATLVKNRVKKILPSVNGNGKVHIAHEDAVAVPVNLERPDIRVLTINIKGITPLIVHKLSEKSRKEMRDKEQQKAKGPRDKRNPKQEYLDSFYMMPKSPAPETKGAKYGIPASGFKRACENVCSGKFVTGLSGSFVRRAFFILDDGDGLVEIKGTKPHMRTDIVRIGKFPSSTPQERYRPEFTEWGCTLRIRYNATAISAEQIVNIFMFAGLHEGWGEMRAGKGGSNGQWEVVNK